MPVVAVNQYASFRGGLDSCPYDWVAITPSDTDDVAANMAHGLYVGVTGDVTVITAAGTTTLFKAGPVGTFIPGLFQRVKATGTTASSICAGFDKQ